MTVHLPPARLLCRRASTRKARVSLPSALPLTGGHDRDAHAQNDAMTHLLVLPRGDANVTRVGYADVHPNDL
jgi:hypothetical protein